MGGRDGPAPRVGAPSLGEYTPTRPARRARSPPRPLSALLLLTAVAAVAGACATPPAPPFAMLSPVAPCATRGAVDCASPVACAAAASVPAAAACCAAASVPAAAARVVAASVPAAAALKARDAAASGFAAAVAPSSRPVTASVPAVSSPMVASVPAAGAGADVLTTGATVGSVPAGGGADVLATAILSAADRADLERVLPRARSAHEVGRSLAAQRRRLARRGRVAVLKHPARAPDERYAVEPIDAPPYRPPGPGEFDASQHAQLGIDGVAAAIEAVASRGVLSAHDLSRAVISALTWQPSQARRLPLKGAAPVASPLNADAIYALAVADPGALPPGLSPVALRDAITHGGDAMYCGVRRHGSTHNSQPPTAVADAQLRAGHAEDVAAGWVLDVTEIYQACPLMPLLLTGLRQVPKTFAPDGVSVLKWRPISDASGPPGVGSNWDVDPSALHPVPLHTMADVARELHRVKAAARGERVVFAAYDYAKAYRQFANRVDDMWLHCYSLDGRVYADLRVSFGARAGGQWLCAVSHLVARAVSRQLGSDGACVCFVDDSGLIVIESAFARGEALFRDLAARVGLEVNEGKVLAPATRQRFIGPEWCTESMRIYLPAAKTQLLCDDLAVAAAAPTMRCRDLLSLLQRMQWASQMVLVLSSCLAPIRALIRGVDPRTRVTLSAEAREAMHACATMLRTSNGSSVVPRAELLADAASTYSDASPWGFGWVCYKTRRFASEAWPAGSPAATAHINALELPAASAAMLDLREQLASAGEPPAAVHVFCDNTAACACISSLGTSSLMLAPGTRALATAAASLDFVPLSTWVQSAANPADAPSRGVIPPELAGWTRVRYAASDVAQWADPHDWQCLRSPRTT